ncbi:MAG: hypothetical protein QF785_12225 [Phycisphaeraceae bacterium]|nr:hypothetical protein [Phycisphaeraceae bacterium]
MPRQRLRDFRMGTRRRKVADERVPQRMKISHPVSVVALSDARSVPVSFEHCGRITTMHGNVEHTRRRCFRCHVLVDQVCRVGPQGQGVVASVFTVCGRDSHRRRVAAQIE